MGPLTSLPTGQIYVDANVLIYTIERVGPYAQMLDPMWQELAIRGQRAMTSELTILETLVGPMRAGNAMLEALFRRVLFRSPTLSLAPITMNVLERATQLRAQTPGLKTPDAIHAATALEVGAVMFITNDLAFQRIPELKAMPPSGLVTP